MRSGIDVASYQHPNDLPIDYRKCVASGVSWVCVKIDEGVSYGNPYAAQDLDGFAQSGAEVAVYHFARPGVTTPEQAAAHFTSLIPAPYAHVVRALDFEKSDGLTWDQLARWAEAFRVAAGVDLLYVNRTWQHGLTSVSLDWPGRWWIAAPSESIIPPEASVWQCGKGAVPGILAECDLDLLPDMEADDMTDDEHRALLATQTAVGDLTVNLTNVSAALDEIKARLTALEGHVSGPGGGPGGPLTITLSGSATPT